QPHAPQLTSTFRPPLRTLFRGSPSRVTRGLLMRFTPLLSWGAATTLALLGGAAVAPAADAPVVADGLKAIKAVSREGSGNEAAAAGWKSIVAAGPDALVPTLTAFEGASPTAANWLRSAVDGIADAERKAKRPLPAAALKSFVLDSSRTPSARRIA